MLTEEEARQTKTAKVDWIWSPVTAVICTIWIFTSLFIKLLTLHCAVIVKCQVSVKLSFTSSYVMVLLNYI